MRKITVVFIILMALTIVAYDIFAIYSGGTEASISKVMIDWSYKYPVFPFLMGFLSGHLFFKISNGGSE